MRKGSRLKAADADGDRDAAGDFLPEPPQGFHEGGEEDKEEFEHRTVF
jgi:hypothetical protein